MYIACLTCNSLILTLGINSQGLESRHYRETVWKRCRQLKTIDRSFGVVVQRGTGLPYRSLSGQGNGSKPDDVEVNFDHNFSYVPII